MPPAYEVLLLNTAVPQIQAAQAGDTYVVPRDIAFSAALTLSAGTANGVPYLNGSKVLTSGSALSFDGTRLAVNGGANGSQFSVKGTSAFVGFDTGAANDGRIEFAYNGTKIFEQEITSSSLMTLKAVSGVSLSFGANNAEQMRLTSTGLGIGTSSPIYDLQVGDYGVDADSTLALASTTAGTGSIRFGDGTSGTDANAGLLRYDHSNNSMLFWTNTTERARITSGGNFKIGGSADRATTEGDKQLVLFDGTAPVGTLANGVSFYSASGEANVMDAAGNATLLSPHDAETNEWIFRSKHTPTGKVLKIDVERLLKFVNDHFGLDAVHEFIED